MDDSRRCTAKSKQSQKRCKNAALLGAKTCRFHGSATKLAKAASARRIMELLVGPALVQLRTLLEAPDTPHAVRLAAIRDILDRTGNKPPLQIEVIARETLEAEYERLLAEADND